MKRCPSAFLYSMAGILCFSLSGCGTNSTTESQPLPTTTAETMATKEPLPGGTDNPYIGELPLEQDIEDFMFGKWKVQKLLGFYNSWNDASEYPDGQDVIGNELIIQSDVFSSLGLKKYEVYQHDFHNPYYYIGEIYYDTASLYRVCKLEIPNLTSNDIVYVIKVAHTLNKLPSMALYCINHDRLILSLDATIFELEKIDV